nr:phosphodiester glycosidase family protein [Paenibacillus larvae]
MEGTLSTQGTVTAKVEQVRSGQGNTTLERSKLVLSGEGSFKAVLDAMQPGDSVAITTSSSAPWNQMQEAIGGIHMLVENGNVASTDQKDIHPRTAVGIKQDRSVFFLIIDGRQPGYSEGISLGDLAILMKEMGAVNALNLDGGGSSTFAARQPGDSQLSVVNRPSDGGERSVANSLLVISTAPQQGLAKLAVNPHQTLMLKGGAN